VLFQEPVSKEMHFVNYRSVRNVVLLHIRKRIEFKKIISPDSCPKKVNSKRKIDSGAVDVIADISVFAFRNRYMTGKHVV